MLNEVNWLNSHFGIPWNHIAFECPIIRAKKKNNNPLELLVFIICYLHYFGFLLPLMLIFYFIFL